MKHFYIGLHQASDARYFDRCCINVQRLARRVKPLGCGELLLDSRAFRVLELHGEHQLTPLAYALLAARIARLCGQITVVTQDYMCERYIFDCRFRLLGVRFSVADHQRLTIARYDELSFYASRLGLSVMPVLQGYSPAEYVSHVLQYGRRLKIGMWVGVGSVCKRNADPSAIRDVLYSIQRVRPDLRLHGFGIKTTSIAHPVVRQQLFSADSMAWSYAARKQGRDANDYREAQIFALGIEGVSLADLPMFCE